MFPCGPHQLLYDPFVKYCKSDGYTARCDPSMCLSGENNWERQACGLYCGDIKREVESDCTELIWQIVSGCLILIVLVQFGVIVYMYIKNRKKEPTPAIEPSAPPMTDGKDNDETCVLLEDRSEADSAVGSEGSETANGSPKSSLISSPQNNHVDPHTRRNDNAGMAVTGVAQNFGAPGGVEAKVEAKIKP